MELDRVLAEFFPPSDVPLEEVNLYDIASILEPYYPEFSLCSLALLVAFAAVQRGCDYLVWEPKQKSCRSPKCSCCPRN